MNPVGISSHLEGLSSANATIQLNLMQQAGIYWVRLEFKWAGIEPTSGTFTFSTYDRLVNGILSRGMHVIGLLTQYHVPSWYGTPSNQPPAPADYASWTSTVAARYAGRIEIYELGNEQNVNNNWYPAADPVAYTALMKAAYTSIKAVDPNVKIACGGIAPTTDYRPDAFLTQMYASGAQGSMDYVSYHPYSWYPDNSGPDVLVPSKPYSFTFNMLDTIRSIMSTNGDGNKQIIATEFGWPTYSSGVKESLQAAYTARVYQKILYENYQYVALACLYDFVDDGTDQTNPENAFGVLHTDLSKKPSYTVLQQTRNAYRTHFNRYDPRVFGSPINLVKSGFRPRALRVFGSPVRWGSSALTVSADSVSLTDRVTFASTMTQSSEAVTISEVLTSVGQPQVAEQVQLSEDTTTLLNVASTTNAVQLLETSQSSGVVQPDSESEVASLFEMSSPTGQVQIATESVQLSESVTIPLTTNRYALRAFGGPVAYGSSAIVIAAEAISLSEQVTLVGVSAVTVIAQFLDAETVAISDAFASVGQTQIAAEHVQLSEVLASALRYALRAFGAPALFTSAGTTRTLQIVDVLSVTLSEESTVSSQTTIVEAASLDETSVLAESIALTEVVALDEAATKAGNSVASESSQLSDALSQVSVASFSDATQLLETLSTRSVFQSTESAQIAETLAVLSLSNFIENIAVADQATSFANTSSLSETVSLTETDTLSASTVISSESVQLLESLTQLILLQFSDAIVALDSSTYAGQPQFVDSVEGSETLVLANATQIASETTQLTDALTLLAIALLATSRRSGLGSVGTRRDGTGITAFVRRDGQVPSTSGRRSGEGIATIERRDGIGIPNTKRRG